MNGLKEKKEEFEIWYSKNEPIYEQAMAFYSNVLASIALVETVKGRLKTKEECINKFEKKYLPLITSHNENYKIEEYITDIIGLRVICFYTEDVPKIRRELKKHFIETEITDKTKILEETDDKFGYRSLHLQLQVRNKLKDQPDAGKFRHIEFELQIRTVIQDAWSILDHKIKYKKSIPQNLKRRINRLSALFEIAEDEFSNVKTEIEAEEHKINVRLKKGGRVESNKPLDVFRFLFIVLKFFPEYNFVENKVDEFVQEILELKGTFTEGQLDKIIKKNLELADSIEKEFKQKLNPYTKIRYCLYASDKKSFVQLLSVYQKNNIDSFVLHLKTQANEHKRKFTDRKE